MLYPQSNSVRTILDLSGIWSFRLSQDQAWQNIAVPASYNDQSPDPEFRNHAGLAWYRTRFTIPTLLKGQRIFLRFDAVTHSARIFINGQEAAAHRGGFLPFEVDLNGLAEPGSEVLLEVEVDNRINHSTLPIGTEGGTAFFGSDNPGITAVEAGKRRQQEKGINLPAFDFFNYAGINRPVRLCSTPLSYIEDVTILPSLTGDIRYCVETVGSGEVTLDVFDADGQKVASASGAEGHFQISQPHLWEPWPGTPYLYNARIHFGGDVYNQSFGIREVRIEGTQFLINGKPFHFHGPCKHEDSPFHGRGLDQCLNMTDINLYHWLGANCFRTSHYPYAEEMYNLCDREGIVIVDETPAVGMWADEHYGWDLAPYHAEVLKALIRRDKNRLSDPTVNRRAGFLDYMQENFPDCKIHNLFIEPTDPAANATVLDGFFSEHPGIRHIVMFNSRIHLIVNYLEEHPERKWRVVGFDNLPLNNEALKRGTVTILIAQRPDEQVRLAVQALADKILFKKDPVHRDHYMPMDILTRFNVDYY